MTGGTLPTRDQLAELIARRRPISPEFRGQWFGGCQALAAAILDEYAGDGYVRDYGSALDAYRASIIESLDPDEAPEGAWHYWAEPDPDGHVQYQGDGYIAHASGVLDEAFAPGAGFLSSAAEYGRRTGHTYLGWSLTNGANHLPITDPESEFLMALPDNDQRHLLNTTISIDAKVTDLGKRVEAIERSLDVPGLPFEWLPALNNKLDAVLAAVREDAPRA